MKYLTTIVRIFFIILLSVFLLQSFSVASLWEDIEDELEKIIDQPDDEPRWDLRVEIPWMNGQAPDVNIGDDVIQPRWNDLSFTNLIKQANVYLRIIAIIVLMLLIVYAWFLLITGRGQPEKLKKANDMLLYVGIWFWVILLAYAIVRIVVNLF